MNSTMVAAAFGFVATLLAGGIGAFATYKVACANLEGIAMRTFLDARLLAFRDFEAAFHTLTLSQDRKDAAALYRAGNEIAMVAEDGTIMKTGELQNIVRKWETGASEMDVSALTQAHIELLYETHQDLITYPRIKRKGHKWRAR